MKDVVVAAVASGVLIAAAGCRSSQSTERAAVHRVERIEARARDSTVVRRQVTLERPIVAIEYADSPARRVVVEARRMVAHTAVEALAESQAESADSVACDAASEQKSTPATVPRTSWIAVVAAFAAGALANRLFRR